MEMEQGEHERRGSGSITERVGGVQDTFMLMQERRAGVRCLLQLSSCPSYYHLLFHQSEKLHCDSRPYRSSDFSLDLFNYNHLKPTPEP